MLRVCLFTAGVVLALTGRATAGLFTIQIDTRGLGTPAATVNGVSATLLSDSSGGFLHFQVQVTTVPGAFVEGDASVFGQLLAADGSVLDQVLVTGDDLENTVDVEFAEAPATLTVPPGAFDSLMPTVDGSFQEVVGVSFPVEGAPDNAGIGVYVAGNVAVTAAPEPASLTLLGLGVAGLAGWRRSKRV
jgi:hypothetical protein